MQLAPNALRSLDRLGVLAAVSRDAVFPAQLLMMDALSGERITAVELGDAFRERYGYPYAVMHRSDLHAHLLRACRDSPAVTLENNRTVVAVEDREDTVHITCAEGATYVTDLLIGADGLHSKVRRMLGDGAAPVCEEYVAFRGTVPMHQMTQDARGDSMVGWAGPEMHLVQYPVRRGELFNQVAVFRSPSYQPDGDAWGTAEELDAKFATMHPLVRASLETIGRDRRWTMSDRPPLADWVRGRIVLVGDAAHPMLQYLAQGACQAIEDAVCLAEMLDRSNSVETGLSQYQDARRSHTARVQLTARLFGEICHASGVAAMFRNAALRRRDTDDYRHFDWLYGYDALAPNPERDATYVTWLQGRATNGPDSTTYPQMQ